MNKGTRRFTYFIVNDWTWWAWLLTSVLLVMGLAGHSKAFIGAMVITAIQGLILLARDRSLAAFSVQIRAGYLVMMLISYPSPMRWFYWLLLAGTFALLVVGYCILARILSLLPWNSDEPHTLERWRRTFFSVPDLGRIATNPAVSGCAGGLCTIEAQVAPPAYANEPPAHRRTVVQFVPLLALMALALSSPAAWAQEILVPDPGLNAAIRETLHKPVGPLTEPDLLTLTNLNACCRNISNIQGLEAARNLVDLDLEANALGGFSFPSNLTRLASLNLSGNPYTNLILPDGLTNLTTLIIESCGLTNFEIPTGLTSLALLELGGNQLTNLTLPAGLTNLNILALQQNQLTSLTLPPDTARLALLLLGGNPFNSLVLPEPTATTILSNTVASLRDEGISVFTYPLQAQLTRLRQPIGAFQFVVTGPPGVYTVLGSANLTAWDELGTVNNQLGKIVFTDGTAHLSGQKFYRVRSP